MSATEDRDFADVRYRMAHWQERERRTVTEARMVAAVRSLEAFYRTTGRPLPADAFDTPEWRAARDLYLDGFDAGMKKVEDELPGRIVATMRRLANPKQEAVIGDLLMAVVVKLRESGFDEAP